VRRGVVVNGGNEFPSQRWKSFGLERMTARGVSPFRHGFAPPCGRNARLWGGGGCPCGGVWWSTDFVTESRTGTDDGARVEVRFDTASPLPAVATQGFGEGEVVRVAGCGGKAVHE
jgi:hypothetical protein